MTVTRASPGARSERALGEREQELGGGGHATPTCTSRKRAGAAPCETCATWPGSPLPQFSSAPEPPFALAEHTASSAPQKRGVTPA